jgi:signal transduction histidine kinase
VSSIPERLRSITPADSAAADFGTRELVAVREIVHSFLTAGRPEEVYQFALDRVSPLVGATFACVYLIDGGSELMRLAAVHKWPERFTSFLGQMRVRLGYGPSGEAASERRAIEVLDIFEDPTLQDWQEVATELGFRSFVALPLQTSDSVVGTVTFYFASSKSISLETRQLMRTVADQMAAAAEKARLIEDLKRANAALSASNAQLERQYADVVEARRIKDEFLANISHELRTPLTAVIGYISLMQDGLAGPINEEQQRTLEQVKESSDELLTLIGDLLELTALKRGALDATFTSLDPRVPMQDALASAKGKRDHVTLEIRQPDIVPSIVSDRRTIAKALKALIENAFKFTKEGSVRVTLSLADNRVVYTVADTGIGIPPNAHELVFEEFRQADGTMTREFGGSGLGLSLARRLAHLVQGEVKLVSSSNEGSTFTLDVPVERRTVAR